MFLAAEGTVKLCSRQTLIKICTNEYAHVLGEVRQRCPRPVLLNKTFCQQPGLQKTEPALDDVLDKFKAAGLTNDDSALMTADYECTDRSLFRYDPYQSSAQNGAYIRTIFFISYRVQLYCTFSNKQT